jgi:hypothetical protein
LVPPWVDDSPVVFLPEVIGESHRDRDARTVTRDPPVCYAEACIGQDCDQRLRVGARATQFLVERDRSGLEIAESQRFAFWGEAGCCEVDEVLEVKLPVLPLRKQGSAGFVNGCSERGVKHI